MRPNYPKYFDGVPERTHPSDTERLEILVGKFVHCKWRDITPLEGWKPEDEKYITRESLIAAIDKELT